MLRTGLCDLLDIEVPVVVAPFGPWDETSLAVEACRAGALGSLGTALRRPAELHAQWQRVRESTDRPFAVNHTGRPFDPEAFAATLEFAPAAISFHMGIPADLIARAHDAGIRWIQAVGDVHAAVRTELVSRLERAPETVDAERVGHELRSRVRAGGGHDLLPFAGQSVQLVHDVVPARELVARLVAEAEEALRTAARAVTTDPTPRARVSSVPPEREPVDEHA